MFDLVQEREIGKSLAPRTMVYVIVHGEPNPNKPNDFSDKGKNQVRDLGRSRVATGVRKVYSSPAEICLKTAGLLRREFDAPVDVKECLKEVALGESKSKDLGARLKKMWDDPEFTYKSGESLFDARHRLVECMNMIGDKHTGDSVAVIVDALLGAVFLSLVRGGNPRIEDWMHCGHASCATYEYSKKGWELLMPPDDSFLADPSSVSDTLPEGVIQSLGDISEESDEFEL
jgi:broad specificity phosphatase PhoE